MTQITTIGERVELIMNKENMNFRSFGKVIGFSDVVVRNVIKGKNKPNFEFLTNIIQTFIWINHTWLLTGKGEMLKPERERKIENSLVGNKIKGQENRINVGNNVGNESSQNTEFEHLYLIEKTKREALEREVELLRDMVEMLKKK